MLVKKCRKYAERTHHTSDSSPHSEAHSLLWYMALSLDMELADTLDPWFLYCMCIPCIVCAIYLLAAEEPER